MNKNYITTIVAGILLLGTGFFWFSQNSKTIHEPTNLGEKRIEIIDGQEVALEIPLTQSFSNAESNKRAAAEKEAENKITKTKAKTKTNYATSSSVANRVVNAVAKPFFIGMYYADILREKGFDACTKSDEGSSQKDIKENYLGDDITVTKTEKILNQVFVYVESKNISKNICARFITSEKFNNLNMDPIHFIVQEKNN